MDKNTIPGIISITGPKHSGKSSAGRELAELLDADFRDLDFSIQEVYGRSPRELYKEGEEIFRRAESAVLRSLLQKRKGRGRLMVIAAGGGIIDNPEAAALLKQNTFVIYLALSSGKAWERIMQSSRLSGELPPFLQTDNPERTQREIHERRARLYREWADYIVNAENDDIKSLGRKIYLYVAEHIL